MLKISKPDVWLDFGMCIELRTFQHFIYYMQENYLREFFYEKPQDRVLHIPVFEILKTSFSQKSWGNCYSIFNIIAMT